MMYFYRIMNTTLFAAAALFIGCSVPGQSNSFTPTIYYVAMDGSDSWDGLTPSQSGESGPFRTLGQAQTAVREVVAKGLTSNIEVQIRGGTYSLDQTLTMDNADSGTEKYSITWRNYQDEKVQLSGGKRIEAQWRRYRGDIWACTLPQVAEGKWIFRDLYADNARQLRARWPNIGTDTMIWKRDDDHHLHPANPELPRVTRLSEDKKTLTLSREIPGTLVGQNVELVHFKYWTINRAHVVQADGNVVTTAAPVGMQGAWYTELILKDRLFLENAEEFIDTPGEWTLRPDGTLLYMVEKGQSPEQKEFIAPQLTTLLALNGSADSPITNVHFVGLIFEHTSWTLPAGGYTPVQATFEGTTDGTIPPHGPAPAAIFCTYARNCSFDQSTLRHTGASGLRLSIGCENSRIVNSEFFDIGGNAIMLGDPASRHAKEPQTQYLTLENNLIHKAGQVMFGGVGIWVGYVKGTTIMHNELRDLPYTALSVGWSWSPIPTTQQDTRIRYNYIHDVVKVLTDGGGIYVLGFQPRSDISHNIITDVLNGNGLYSDQGTSELVFEGNVVDRIGFGGPVDNMGHAYYQHLESRDVIVKNNLFARSYLELIGRREPKPLNHLAVTFSNNIFISSGISDRELFWEDKNEMERQDEYKFEKNCYYRTDDAALTFSGKSWHQWQALGKDTGSHLHTNAAPVFENPEHKGNNYSIKMDTDCLEKIGFTPLEVQKAGRYRTR